MIVVDEFLVDTKTIDQSISNKIDNLSRYLQQTTSYYQICDHINNDRLVHFHFVLSDTNVLDHPDMRNTKLDQDDNHSIAFQQDERFLFYRLSSIPHIFEINMKSLILVHVVTKRKSFSNVYENKIEFLTDSFSSSNLPHSNLEISALQASAKYSTKRQSLKTTDCN